MWTPSFSALKQAPLQFLSQSVAPSCSRFCLRAVTVSIFFPTASLNLDFVIAQDVEGVLPCGPAAWYGGRAKNTK